MAVIDAAFLAERLTAARDLRERLFPGGFYRLIHAEADGMPGLVIDRFGDAVVVQANTAGMDRLLPELLAAIDQVLAPKIVVLRNDFKCAHDGKAREPRARRQGRAERRC